MSFVLENVKHDAGRVYVFRGKEILLNEDGSPAGAGVLPLLEVPCVVDFEVRGSECGAVLVPSSCPAPEGCSFSPLRTLYTTCDCGLSTEMSRMKAYAGWLASTRFCPSCGARLQPHSVENALVCPSCGKVHYPKIEPCVIAVIEKGDEILLLRHVLRNQDMYCCLAGFVESGESLEHALAREVREETGLEISNIRYAGSQSWPFPDQLMVGFYADYAGGELKIQEDEISEARWFKKDELPNHPPEGSISWNLIHYIKAEF